MKITVVGSGMVGSTTALRILEEEIAHELTIVDVVEGLAQAVALDLAQAAPLRGHTIDIKGGSDYGPTEGSDVVIVTAGLPRKPGQSRADLLSTNAEIVHGVVDEIVPRSPGAVLVVVTNPLDEMTTLAWRASGFPPERVIGMAGALDTSRFRYFVAAELGTTPDRVDALVLGSHGETMVPLPRLTTVGGRPLSGLLAPEDIDRLVERTREAGGEIVALLPRGSAWMAPSAAISDMAVAIARDTGEIVSACAYLRGEYGLSDVFLGVPVRLGKGGVKEIVELPLTADELSLLRRAGETVRERAADLDLDDAYAPGSGSEKAGSPARGGIQPGGEVAALRLESRVRRAVEQVLWERGRPPSSEVEALTEAVIKHVTAG